MSPTRSPPSDAVERCREAMTWLRDAELTRDPDVDPLDIATLRDIFLKPHFKVSHFSSDFDETLRGFV